MTYTQPLLALFLILAAVAFLVRRRWLRNTLAVAGIGGLFVISWPPLDWIFSRPLEARYPVRPFVAPPDLQALVVFAERVRRAQFERPYALASEATYERCMHAAWIYQKFGPMPILVSGGPPVPGFPSAAMTLREILLANGVAANMVWTEEVSQSTHENALYGAEILRQHGVDRVALVVDATSMPRAAACLQKAGIKVYPAPSDFREFASLHEELWPSSRALMRNEDTLHEVIGLLWYRMRGWI